MCEFFEKNARTLHYLFLWHVDGRKRRFIGFCARCDRAFLRGDSEIYRLSTVYALNGALNHRQYKYAPMSDVVHAHSHRVYKTRVHTRLECISEEINTSIVTSSHRRHFVTLFMPHVRLLIISICVWSLSQSIPIQIPFQGVCGKLVALIIALILSIQSL